MCSVVQDDFQPESVEVIKPNIRYVFSLWKSLHSLITVILIFQIELWL